MKYLKLYESFNNIESCKEELNDLFINFVPINKRINEKKKLKRELPHEILYEPINSIECDEWIKSHEMIHFNKEELDYLSKLSKNTRLNPIPFSNADFFIIGSDNGNHFVISKFEDDWFIIKHGDDSNKMVNQFPIWKYYKCDTFDGVKQLFGEQKKLGNL